MKTSVVTILFSLFLIVCNAQKKKIESKWVYAGNNEKLIYKTTPNGDRIMDFSHAGYMGGGVKLPLIPASVLVDPLPDADNTQHIQEAINKVASLPLQNGFRGAVQLSPGVFICKGTLNIQESGIVLRGSGAHGTTILMEGAKHPAIKISGNSEVNKSQEKKTNNIISAKITDKYVPAGSSSFTVDDASTFFPGDIIVIYRPVTAAWIHFMDMDNLVRDGKPQTWISKSRYEIAERKIISKSGNKIMVEASLPDSYNEMYLEPAGAFIKKMENTNKIYNVGIEDLHIKCAPLEIDYGHAPYSGIRINANNCWVKNIYFEETMNTTILGGNYITMQGIKIKHTYPNLGASKPTDFSIEGSFNLIDRCYVTGGNTYFVWTGSLETGPNVVLNSVFKGHGSRIQPHQRWSTGLLIDNCVVPDGGIDFMNRGVAGSGHGWTMGWAVAWNCIAKTYVIQNPPGAINWAIGCIGERVMTARLFDSAPVLEEGIFDSYGQFVAPQSLYLAQLKDRLGVKAISNIGYTPGEQSLVTSKNIKPSSPLPQKKDPVFGADLAMFRPVNTSNVREGKRQFGAEKALDGLDNTYWATNDGVNKATFEIDTEGPLDIDAIKLSEPTGIAAKVRKYKIEGQVNSNWTLLGEGNSIGKNKLLTFPKTTVWKVRITISDADNFIALSEVRLFLKNRKKINH